MRLMVLTLTGYAMPCQPRPLQWLLLITVEQECPGAGDRGGVPEDGVNFTQFLKELEEENKKQPKRYIVSYTAPTSFWYLRHFDLKSIDYVDFVNVMSYE